MTQRKTHAGNRGTLIPHSSEHPLYKPGEIVFVSPRLREIHPDAPASGQQVIVCEGTYYTSDQPEVAFALRQKEKACPHISLVPVVFAGNVWLIEEEYIERQ